MHQMDAPTGDDLRAWRNAAGLSRRALAARCDLHADTVRYWERKAHLDLRGHAPVRMLNALGLGNSFTHDFFPVRAPRASSFGDFTNTTRARDGVLGTTRFCGHQKRCGARTRKGTPCRSQSLPGKTRCKFHGGASTGPKTEEGRSRIAEAQRRRWLMWRLERER